MSLALSGITIPFHAFNHNNSRCNSCECLLAIAKFQKYLVLAVGAADHVLQRWKQGLSKTYCSLELSVLKRKSFDAHNLWKDCNCPRSGLVFLEKMRAYQEFKLLLRKSKVTTQRSMSDKLSSNLQSENFDCF